MKPLVTIVMTIEDVNHTLSGVAEMNCVAVWRSAGSNVFFEFGLPTIKRITPKTRKPFTVVRGEAAIGVHADNWSLRVGPRIVLESMTVDDANLSKVAGEFFLGIPVPRFGMDHQGSLELLFDRSMSVKIESNVYPEDAGDSYDEVSVNLPAVGFRFNYKRGFYLVPDK